MERTWSCSGVGKGVADGEKTLDGENEETDLSWGLSGSDRGAAITDDFRAPGPSPRRGVLDIHRSNHNGRQRNGRQRLLLTILHTTHRFNQAHSFWSRLVY